MNESVKMIFYKVNKCGFYSNKRGKHLFCTFHDLLKEYKNWVSVAGRNLVETCTYEIDDGQDILRTFCYDIDYDQTNKSFLICTWNEIPSNNGQIPSLPSTATIGQGQVSFTKLPKNNIPGYATYFYAIPEKNILATIIFEGLLNGRTGLVKLMKGYMEKYSKYVVIGNNSDGITKVVGYRENEKSEPLHAEVYFQSYLYENPGEIDLIKNNIKRVNRIHRKAVLDYKVALDLEMWQKLINKLGIQHPVNAVTTQKLKYEMPIDLNAKEFNEIVDLWKIERDEEYSDFGFSFSGESSKIHWLSKSIARADLEVNITRKDREIVNLKSLHQAIISQQSKILGVLK